MISRRSSFPGHAIERQLFSKVQADVPLRPPNLRTMELVLVRSLLHECSNPILTVINLDSFSWVAKINETRQTIAPPGR